MIGIFANRLVGAGILFRGKVVLNMSSCNSSRTSRMVSTTKGCVYPNFVSKRVRVRDAVLAYPRFTGATISRNAATMVTSPRRVTGIDNGSNLHCVVRSDRNLPLAICFMVPSYIPTADFSRSNTILSTSSVRRFCSRDHILKLNRIVGCINIITKSNRLRGGVGSTLSHKLIMGNRTPLLSNGPLSGCVSTKVKSSRRYSSTSRTGRHVHGKREVVVERNATTEGLSKLVSLFSSP